MSAVATDRLALELGRAILRAIQAEDRADRAEAALHAADDARDESKNPPSPDKT